MAKEGVKRAAKLAQLKRDPQPVAGVIGTVVHETDLARGAAIAFDEPGREPASWVQADTATLAEDLGQAGHPSPLPPKNDDVIMAHPDGRRTEVARNSVEIMAELGWVVIE